MDLSISLKAARVNANMTQNEVARKMNVSNNTIIAWESGKHTPRIDQAQELCKLYGIPMNAVSFCPNGTL